jgi:hypothetical protein
VFADRIISVWMSRYSGDGRAPGLTRCIELHMLLLSPCGIPKEPSLGPRKVGPNQRWVPWPTPALRRAREGYLGRAIGPSIVLEGGRWAPTPPASCAAVLQGAHDERLRFLTLPSSGHPHSIEVSLAASIDA